MNIVDRAIEKYNPSHMFAMFSGGHDSYCATHLISQHPLFTGVCHINTGIGIEQTRQFVRDRCKEHNWKLSEYRATEYVNGKGKLSPQCYRDLVLKWGFPGPPVHQLMYIRLKEKALRHFIRNHKTHHRDKILLVTGIRKQESKRRMGKAKEIVQDGAIVWACPIFDWTKDQVNQYMTDNNLPHNEVVDILHMSGECLCGAFAHEGELAMIETFFPEEGKIIRDLEKEVREAGFPWGWEDRPPEWYLEHKKGQMLMPLCFDCLKVNIS